MASGQPASGEDSLIARYFRPLATDPGAFGLDDDAAALKPTGDDIVVTTDAIVEGVHFLPDDPPDTIARKALRVNLSDLAAKGATPAGFVLTLALRNADEAWLKPFARGARRGCRAVRLSAARRRYRVDAGAADDFGHGVRPRAAGQDGSSQRRQARRPGDGDRHDRRCRARACRLRGGKVHAAGRRCGRARALIGRYRVPQPRMALAEIVRDHASAAMDVSDGLAGDLAKLCGVSGVSAEIDVASIPLSDAARDLVSRGIVGLETLIAGGDDYEILCTVPEDRVEAFVQAARRAGVAVSSIGTVVAGSAVPKFLDGQGSEIVLERRSYSHF